ncbi:MAG: hypothetical protein L3J42_00500, partial [Hydrogenimonas sp.]|nr:hypothetical protein [Hydrogenimonas sp.]
ADLKIDKKILHISIKREEFLRMALQMAKAVKLVDKEMRPYLFLYILSCFKKIPSQLLCERIHTPNIYKKVLKFQKCVPSRITDRFLAAVALKMAIRQWLGVYADRVKKRSIKLGIYERGFDPGIRPADLLEEGYAGKRLGEELRRRVLETLRKRFSKDIS